MKKDLKIYIYAALFAALTFVATWIPKLPIPATEGYIHLGDTIIVVASMLFGPVIGGFTGAIGSALADMAGGYAMYILPTFIIKGLMGFVIGKLCYQFETLKIKEYLGLLFGGIILVGGYYLAEVILYHNFITPIASLGFNVAQYLVGVIVGLFLYRSLKNKVSK